MDLNNLMLIDVWFGEDQRTECYKGTHVEKRVDYVFSFYGLPHTC